MARRGLIVAVVFALAVPAAGDVGRLRDGSIMVGTVHAADGGYSVASEGGGVSHVAAAADVRWFEVTGRPATRPAGVDKAAAADRANELAAHAREALRREDRAGAAGAVRAALDVDRGNASALYLRGVMAFDDGDVPAARRAFEAVDRQVPNDGPTLNDLAVVLSRQNRPVAAMIRFDAAMKASPGDRRVLDNVAIAMRLLPVEAARAAAVVRAVDRFRDQDSDLAKRMRATGQRRVNGVWMSDEQVAGLDDHQRRAVAALDGLSAGAVADAKGLSDLDAKLAAVDREWLGIGTAPPTRRRAAELSAAADRLRLDRAVIADRLTLADAAAEQLRGQLPMPVGGPRQRMIGAEGTPFVPAAVSPPAGKPDRAVRP